MNIKKIAAALSAAAALLLYIPEKNHVCADCTYTCDYMYSVLKTAGERAFYDALLETCNSVQESNYTYEYTPYVSFAKNISLDRAREIGYIFSMDHPEFFWISTETKYSSFYGFAYKLLPSFRTGPQRQAARGMIEMEAEKYINEAQKLSTDYEKAKFLQDKLLDNVVYKEGEWSQTVASVFLEKETVCAGFSKAYEMLCNAVGIPSLVITSCSHAWNAVNIGGKWYLTDITNDRPTGRFFLISEARMSEIDRALGTQFEVSHKENGVEQIYKFYLHDIDILSYRTYYDSFPQCAYTFGDANGDNARNVRDAAFIARNLAEGKANTLDFRSDFNLDGKINVRDAAALAKELA